MIFFIELEKLLPLRLSYRRILIVITITKTSFLEASLLLLWYLYASSYDLYGIRCQSADYPNSVVRSSCF